ncbi:MAG: penicillin-binding transpeptidase domain-containing protein [Alphaproteobacteria bacterium]|nr:penicillin-binding transpeptidase domain-containing protein [Alphaproteobacteria bacterium]
MIVVDNVRRLVWFTLVAIWLLGTSNSSFAETSRTIPRDPHASRLGDRMVSFLARDLETSVDYVLEGSDLDGRHAPWSTFKIPNLLIALETGIAPSLEAERQWDPARRPAASYWPRDWRGDQTLRTAFRRSAVWYFQDLSLEIGAEHYRATLRDWHYGNAVAADGSDRFWLDRSLQVSVREQVEFLDRLLHGELVVSGASIDALSEASLAGRFEGSSLHGKTGSGPAIPGRFNGAFEGWYSGFVLRPGQKPVVFSLFVTAPSFNSLRDFRKDFAVHLLKETGLLDADFP